MPRYIQQGWWFDGNGKVVKSGTVTVYLAGTSTAASIYTASSGGTAVNAVTASSTDGSWSFYVDTDDYTRTQKFKIVFSKSGFTSKTIDDVVVFPESFKDGINVDDYGATGDDSDDDAAAINQALALGGKISFTPGKTYKVSGANLTLISNTELYIPVGAAIHLATTRIMASDVNNIKIWGGGKIYSTDINSTDSIPTNWAGLGMINFGSTTNTPATGFHVKGIEIYMDWIGPYTYPSYGEVKTGSININTHSLMGGIYIWGATNVTILNNYFHNMLGEAIMHNQGGTTIALPSDNLGYRIIGNYFANCNHDGISGQQCIIEDAVYSNNVMYNCLMGAEVLSGVVSNNTIIYPVIAGIGCGGNNVGKLSILNNTVLYSYGLGINMEETPSGTLVDAKINIVGNTVYGTANDGIVAISNGVNTATMAVQGNYCELIGTITGWQSSVGAAAIKAGNIVGSISGNTLVGAGVTDINGLYICAASPNLLIGPNTITGFLYNHSDKAGFTIDSAVMNGLITDRVLSITPVSFAANADTTLYTVPTGYRCVLTKAVVIAGADAGATTTLSIGQNGAETDFIPANTLSNLDAANDVVILQPIPNTTPLKNKSYAAATVIQAQVANQSGGGSNYIMLFGYLY